MALCQGLVDLIDDSLASEQYTRLRRVVVEIGALGHVDPHALGFAFEVAARGTPAEQAALDIRELPGRAWCMGCLQTVEIQERGGDCPHCGSAQLIVEAGEELRLKELEVV